jgi:hypothetical protein
MNEPAAQKNSAAPSRTDIPPHSRSFSRKADPPQLT